MTWPTRPASGGSRRARTPASTTGRATTGRMPTRGSKAARLAWLERSAPAPARAARPVPDNPFLAERPSRPRSQSVRPGSTRCRTRSSTTTMPRPSRTRSPRRPSVGRPSRPDAPRKLQLLGARARRRRELREGPRTRRRAGRLLPVRAADRLSAGAADARPLSAAARRAASRGHHVHRDDPGGAGRGPRRCAWSQAVCDDLATRGFAAVEAYPEVAARPDATSAATPAFWEAAGFTLRDRRRAVPGHAAGADLRPRRSAGRRTRGAAVALLVVALGLVACDGDPGGTGTPAPTSAAPSPSVQPTQAAASPSPVPTASGSGRDRPAASPSTCRCSITCPPTVDGLTVDADAETAATHRGVAGPRRPMPRPSRSPDVVRRRPATISRSRASSVSGPGPFDAESLRALAHDVRRGGLRTCRRRGRDESATGRRARRSSSAVCNGGAQTYHVALGDDILVSITAIGERQLGDRLVAGLRE